MKSGSTRRRFLARSLNASIGISGLAGFAANASADEELPLVDQNIRELARTAPLSMQFRGTTASECRLWQQAFRSKLAELLGDIQPPQKWQTKVVETAQLPDHTRHELLLSADGHPDLPVYLLVPRDLKAKRVPGIVAVHGHGKHGFDPVAGRDDRPGVKQAIDAANYDYGRQLVRRGYLVACPCLQPFGFRVGAREAYGSDPCAVTYVRLQLLGKVLIAENLRDVLWSRSLLCADERVDPDRLACVGLSYGGRTTMLAAAMEPGFKVAVISGALNVMQERVQVRYSCGAQVIPGLLRYGDVPEISSLIAPRAAVWEVGSDDGLIKDDWAQQALVRISRAYAAYDAQDQLHVDRFNGVHRFNGKVAFKVLSQQLDYRS